MQLLQDPIAVRALWLAEDVIAAEPGGESEAGQQQDRDRPTEEIYLPPPMRIRLIIAEVTVFHLRARVTHAFMQPGPLRKKFRSRKSARRWDSRFESRCR